MLLSILRIVRFISSHPLTRHHKLSAFGCLLRWQVQSRIRTEVVHPWVAVEPSGRKTRNDRCHGKHLRGSSRVRRHDVRCFTFCDPATSFLMSEPTSEVTPSLLLAFATPGLSHLSLIRTQGEAFSERFHQRPEPSSHDRSSSRGGYRGCLDDSPSAAIPSTRLLELTGSTRV